MKKCSRCHVKKPRSRQFFYAAKTHTDGLQGICIECMVKASRVWRKTKRTPEYTAWANVIQRCTNKNKRDYAWYGGRGIKVCDRWLESFDNFLEDMGEKPSPNHSIDRINNDGDYSPENCKWSTATEQARNKGVGKSNTSGFYGVNWHKRSKKWQARITVNGKRIALGSFDDIKDAAKAREKAETKYWNK